MDIYYRHQIDPTVCQIICYYSRILELIIGLSVQTFRYYAGIAIVFGTTTVPYNTMPLMSFLNAILDQKLNKREIAELNLTWLILKDKLWHTAPYSLATLAPVGSIAAGLLVNYQT